MINEIRDMIKGMHFPKIWKYSSLIDEYKSDDLDMYLNIDGLIKTEMSIWTDNKPSEDIDIKDVKIFDIHIYEYYDTMRLSANGEIVTYNGDVYKYCIWGLFKEMV